MLLVSVCAKNKYKAGCRDLTGKWTVSRLIDPGKNQRIVTQKSRSLNVHDVFAIVPQRLIGKWRVPAKVCWTR